MLTNCDEDDWPELEYADGLLACDIAVDVLYIDAHSGRQLSEIERRAVRQLLVIWHRRQVDRNPEGLWNINNDMNIHVNIGLCSVLRPRQHTIWETD